MIRKITILLVAAVAIAFLGFAIAAFGLPKDQKAPAPANAGTPAKIQQPAAARRIDANPVRFGPDRNAVPNSGSLLFPTDPDYRSLAPTSIGATTVPFVTVQVGTVEFGFTNNTMRDISVHLVAGRAQVHMTYPIYTGFNTSPWTGAAADSFQSRTPIFYNSYNVGGGNALNYPAPGLRLNKVFPGLAPDDRFRELGWGGGVLNFTSATQKVVAYGNRYIQRTDLGAYLWSFRGTGVMQDVEGTGLFDMSGSDTTMNMNRTIPNTDPVARAINESTWVATYDGEDPNKVYFNYTTDRGLSWSVPIISPMATSWWNCIDIASSGNTFYLTGMSNPAVPTTFWVTERPVYVKGTYNPVSGTITFGAMQDITGDFALPAFLPIPHSLQSVMVGTTLHVTWNDWNDYNGQGFPGPGGRVWHASVDAAGSVSGPHKIANINIDGLLPDRSTTLFGFAQGPWGSGQGLSYNAATGILYATWSQPREEYDAITGAPTFQWDDPWAGLMSNHDIYCSASNNGGIAWDNPVNITDTKNVGCAGTAGSPCQHEDYFSAYPEVVADTIWIGAIHKRKPGFRQVAFEAGITADPGSFQMLGTEIRLYKAPARPVVAGVRPDLLLAAGDTTNLTSIVMAPRGSHSVNMSLGNIGTVGFFLDSVVVEPSLNEGSGPDQLSVTSDAVPGTFVDVGGSYPFQLSYDASQVPVRAGGTRSGLVQAYCHTTDGSVVPPNDKATGLVASAVNILTSFCLNRQIRIHSGNNSTDVGTQGSVADEAGTAGLIYNEGLADESNRFYDGGVWIANSNLFDAGGCDGPRRVTRQIFSDDFLRCIADGELDSVAIGGGRYNLWLRSVGTDVEDSSLVWENIWEQSTHPDSSDFLVHTVKVINTNQGTIDSVALGVLYDIDVFSAISQPARNVGGDTIITGADGRSYHLGWIAGNDVAVDTCSPNAQLYGIIVIPNPCSAPPPVAGPTIEPRLAVVYRQTAFSYNLDCHGSGGDTLAERWSYNVTGFWSTNGRIRNRVGADSLVYEFQDATVGADTCLDGRLWRADMGFMTIAKKVYNFPVNIGAREVVGRYGLGALAASVDTFFRGSGECYSTIHVGSITGLGGLIANAQKATKWFWDHAALQVDNNPLVKNLVADLNASRTLSGSDIVAEINYIFNDADSPFGPLVPKCVADINGDGNLSGADIVTIINGTFQAPGGVNPSAVCPLCLTSCN